YNGAQQIAYTSIILMGAGSLVTGLAIWKSAQFAWLTALLGGYEAARLEHFLLTLGYCGFFFVHIAQVIRAGWNNLRAMITGYEIQGGPMEEGSIRGELDRRMAGMTRRSLLVGGAAALAGGAVWEWIRTRRLIGSFNSVTSGWDWTTFGLCPRPS